MADKPTLAQAWIGLVPTLDGGTRAIENELRGVNSRGVGNTIGTGMGGGIVAAAKKFVAPLAAVFAGAQLIDFGKEAITEASDLGESINALNVVFGDSAAGIAALGEAAATSLGLSNVEFNSLAVQFSSFAQAVSGDGGDVTGVMQDLTTRAADFASVMNLEVADAAALFQSTLAGESEPIRRYGIDMSAAAVSAYAMANGIWDGEGAISASEATLARYQLLMENTDVTAGDFANTSDSLANQQRILGAQWDNLKATLGTAFLPVVESAVTLFNQAVPVISGMAQGFSDWFTAISTGQGDASWFADFLETVRPSAEALYVTFQEDLKPALDELWVTIQSDVMPQLEAMSPAISAITTDLLDMGNMIAEWVGPETIKFGGDVLSFMAGNLQRTAVGFAVVVDAISGFVGWVRTTSATVEQFARRLPEQMRRGLSGLYSAIVTPFRDAFNEVARLWNNSIGAISIDIPDWVGLGIGGETWSVADIPQLATGALVTGPTLAWVGEGKHDEIVRTVPDYVADLQRAADSGMGGADLLAAIKEQTREIVEGVLAGSQNLDHTAFASMSRSQAGSSNIQGRLA